MESKKFKSLVHRVVLLPLMVMIFVELITIISCCVTLINVETQIRESNINSLQISQYNLDSLINQIDNKYVQFWSNSELYRFISSYNEKTTPEEYMPKITKNGEWMQELVREDAEVQGSFCYLANIDQKVFRGSSDPEMHQYIDELLAGSDHEKKLFNIWQLASVNGKEYLINFRKYNDYYGGVWIPLDIMTKRLALNDPGLRGITFFEDDTGNVVFTSDSAPEIKEARYPNVIDNKVKVGIVFDRYEIYKSLDKRLIFLLVLAILGLFCIPFIINWLRNKIAEPIKTIDTAMKLIGEGNVDYRISIPDKPYYDEFDRLSERINETMDEINEISSNLYEAEIKQQKMQLRGMSQQIRPHFILNALNVIYTYEEDEFPLVKKMVLYLTEYFRYIVNIRREYVELEREMHHVENYLNIQKERYLDKFFFFVEWESSTGKLLVPPIIIQTFAENCVKYGMNEEGQTQIFVLACIEDQKLKIMVADTGNGFSTDLMEKVERYKETEEHQEGLGVGYENTIERLKIMYGKEADLKLRNAVSGGAVVEIYLPIVEEA